MGFGSTSDPCSNFGFSVNRSQSWSNLSFDSVFVPVTSRFRFGSTMNNRTNARRQPASEVEVVQVGPNSEFTTRTAFIVRRAGVNRAHRSRTYITTGIGSSSFRMIALIPSFGFSIFTRALFYKESQTQPL
ncbi:uncharacterized protein LOC110873861 isoform X1 [Helianthus annuus]|uniref:uncharacterized protein LOC110873861 isoform X1 n=1 Tax=Helianthus annuus TaxID=4232 RepID=UPI001652C965|nr:uncharacterized protein LOC110873861 isoform X1 [Helianthus annuus]